MRRSAQLFVNRRRERVRVRACYPALCVSFRLSSEFSCLSPVCLHVFMLSLGQILTEKDAYGGLHLRPLPADGARTRIVSLLCNLISLLLFPSLAFFSLLFFSFRRHGPLWPGAHPREALPCALPALRQNRARKPIRTAYEYETRNSVFVSSCIFLPLSPRGT